MNSFNKKSNKLDAAAAKKTYNDRVNGGNQYDVFPWNNHDFDYKQVVNNKYSPKKLGITSYPCIDATIHDSIQTAKYGDMLLTQPIPDSRTIAGHTDVDRANRTSLYYKSKYSKL